MWNHEEIPLLCRTGQTVVYRTGDDGSFQAGQPGGNRLRDMGDGTIHDRHTSLVWVKQPELIIPGPAGVHPTNQVQVARGNWGNAHAYAQADLVKDTAGGTFWVCGVAHTSPAAPTTFAQDRAANPTRWRQTIWSATAVYLNTPAAMNWDAAVDACLALEYAGHDDWRLPNALELASIQDYGRSADPGVDPSFWPNIVSSCPYWTATAPPAGPDTRVLRCLSISISEYADDKTLEYYLLPVRGGRTHV
jgi:hypothetical protein